MYTDGKVIKQCGNIVKIGQAKLFGVVPFPVLFMIVFLIITWVLLTRRDSGNMSMRWAATWNPRAQRYPYRIGDHEDLCITRYAWRLRCIVHGKT